MDQKRKAMNFYRSYYDVARKLPKKIQGEFLMAILDYQFEGKDANFDHITDESDKLFLEICWAGQVHSLEKQLVGYKNGMKSKSASGGASGGASGQEQEQVQVQVQEKDKEQVKEESNIPYVEIQRIYNDVCLSLPKIQKLSQTRKNKIKGFLKDNTLQDLGDLFKKVQASDFLTGRKTEWSADFDWIMKPANTLKIQEGNYDNKQKQNDFVMDLAEKVRQGAEMAKQKLI